MSDWDRTLAGAADATLRGMSAGMRVFGRFVLERKLGQGGMGVVWLARDARLDQEVALKFLPETVRMDPVAVADLKRETKRALKLTHPNIVRVHDFHEDGGLSAIAMEYVDGSSLSAVRAEQSNMCLETGLLGPLMGPLCAALEYAHVEAKFVHRDIKPANLMVDRQWRIKITDFGIARSLVESMSRLSAGRSTSGTLVYMSPQQLDGEPPSPSDDIYSLGATIYELLTGKPPFYAGGIERQIMEKVPPPMAQRRVELGVTGQPIPLQWEAVVATCLEKDPARRPQRAGEVVARLGARGQRLAGAPSARHSTSVQGEVRKAETAGVSAERRERKRGSGVGAVIGVGLVLAAVGVGGWWFGYEAPRREAKRIAEEQRVAAEAQQREDTRKAAEAEKARLEEEARRQAADQERQRQVAMEAERMAKARGGLLVRTEPAGALVSVDGGEGRPGPAAFSDLKLGKHLVQVTQVGCDTVREEVEVSEGTVTELGPISLSRQLGSLRVESRPPGSRFLVIDDSGSIIRSGDTPAAFADLAAGPYRVVICRPGCADQTQTVTVAKGPEARVESVFPSGSLSVRSEPSGLEYEAEGPVIRRGSTPETLSEIPSGQYRVVVRRNGWPAHTQTVFVEGDGSGQVNARFPEGSVTIRSSPSGASVFIGTRLIGQTPVRIGNMPPGRVSVELRKDGYRNIVLSGTVMDGVDQTLTGELEENVILNSRFPYGTRVVGKPGFVLSPHKPTAGLVDIRDPGTGSQYPRGTQVRCPYTNRIFLAP